MPTFLMIWYIVFIGSCILLLSQILTELVGTFFFLSQSCFTWLFSKMTNIKNTWISSLYKTHNFDIERIYFNWPSVHLLPSLEIIHRYVDVYTSRPFPVLSYVCTHGRGDREGGILVISLHMWGLFCSNRSWGSMPMHINTLFILQIVEDGWFNNNCIYD